jgi:hypothetical protein
MGSSATESFVGILTSPDLTYELFEFALNAPSLDREE